MSGSVARRPDGRWRARYRDAAHREHAKHFRRKVDAERWLAGVSVAQARGEWVDPRASRITVEQWAPHWLEGQVHVRPGTRLGYAYIIKNRIVPTWGRVQLRHIEHGDVVTWVARMSQTGLSPSTIRHTFRVFSLMLDLAVKDNRLARNAPKGVRLPRAEPAEKRFLSHRQVQDLARECGEPYDLVILVLAYTGLRWGEMSGLRVGDVDLGRRRIAVNRAVTEVSGRIVVATPKNYQRRSVPLPEVVMDRMHDLVAGRDREEPLFASPQGGVLRNGNFRRNVFDAAASRAGLAGLTPHELRHTAASLAVAAGASVKTVQRMLGHSSAAMTLDVYSGLFDDELSDVAERLSRAAATATADFLRTNWGLSLVEGDPDGSALGA
ncbi:MAG: tyrosine-type recombinase/integrase [Oryzihumus sp.]